MTERLHIGTHKGLFELARHNGIWDIADVQFLGDPVSAVLQAKIESIVAYCRICSKSAAESPLKVETLGGAVSASVGLEI